MREEEEKEEERGHVWDGECCHGTLQHDHSRKERKSIIIRDYPTRYKKKCVIVLMKCYNATFFFSCQFRPALSQSNNEEIIMNSLRCVCQCLCNLIRQGMENSLAWWTEINATKISAYIKIAKNRRNEKRKKKVVGKSIVILFLFHFFYFHISPESRFFFSFTAILSAFLYHCDVFIFSWSQLHVITIHVVL